MIFIAIVIHHFFDMVSVLEPFGRTVYRTIRIINNEFLVMRLFIVNNPLSSIIAASTVLSGASKHPKLCIDRLSRCEHETPAF